MKNYFLAVILSIGSFSYEMYGMAMPKGKETLQQIEGKLKAQNALQKQLNDAAASGDLDRVKKLISQGADPNVAHGDYGYLKVTPLAHAFYNGKMEIANFLLTYPEVDLKESPQQWRNFGTDERVPLIVLLANDNMYNFVKILLDKGVAVESKTYTGVTPLMAAVASRVDTSKLIDLLLAYGADMYAQDSRGLIGPMLNITFNGNIKNLEKLRDKGFDINKVDLVKLQSSQYSSRDAIQKFRFIFEKKPAHKVARQPLLDTPEHKAIVEAEAKKAGREKDVVEIPAISGIRSLIADYAVGPLTDDEREELRKELEAEQLLPAAPGGPGQCERKIEAGQSK